MDFYAKVSQITQRDSRYKADAYEFVMQALWFTQKKLNRAGHVSGLELLGGIRELGLEQYGPMARAVFKHWGVNNTGDFGRIVFNMISDAVMAKSENDSLDDFKDVYNFKEALDIFKPVKSKQ